MLGGREVLTFSITILEETAGRTLWLETQDNWSASEMFLIQSGALVSMWLCYFSLHKFIEVPKYSYSYINTKACSTKQKLLLASLKRVCIFKYVPCITLGWFCVLYKPILKLFPKKNSKCFFFEQRNNSNIDLRLKHLNVPREYLTACMYASMCLRKQVSSCTLSTL